MLDTSILYVLYILGVLGVEVLVAGLIWIWWQTLRNQQAQFQKATQQTYARLGKIIEETTQQSQKALSAALTKASSLQKITETQTQDMAKQTQDLLKQQTQWQETTNQKLWVAYQDTLNQETKKATDNLGQVVMVQSLKLADEVQETLAQSTQVIKTQLQTELEKAETEIAAYKQSEIERIHQISQQIIGQITTEIIGQQLSQKDHHQLVTQQLNKALTQLKPTNE